MIKKIRANIFNFCSQLSCRYNTNSSSPATASSAAGTTAAIAGSTATVPPIASGGCQSSNSGGKATPWPPVEETMKYQIVVEMQFGVHQL